MHRLVIHIFFLVAIAVSSGQVFADNAPAKKLDFDEFIRLAAEKDTEFEKILIEELVINYSKDLKLPADDLVLSVRQTHEFFIDQETFEVFFPIYFIYTCFVEYEDLVLAVVLLVAVTITQTTAMS